SSQPRRASRLRRETGRVQGISPWSSACEAVDGLEHLIGGMNNTGIRFVGTLRQNHLNEFANNVDVGVLKGALLNCAKSFRAAGRADDGIAGRRGLQKIVVADTAETARIRKRG